MSNLIGEIGERISEECGDFLITEREVTLLWHHLVIVTPYPLRAETKAFIRERLYWNVPALYKVTLTFARYVMRTRIEFKIVQ